jgi:hypothetical protein
MKASAGSIDSMHLQSSGRRQTSPGDPVIGRILMSMRMTKNQLMAFSLILESKSYFKIIPTCNQRTG